MTGVGSMKRLKSTDVDAVALKVGAAGVVGVIMLFVGGLKKHLAAGLMVRSFLTRSMA